MMHSSGSKNPCSNICTGEVKYTVLRSIFYSFWRNPWTLLAEPPFKNTALVYRESNTGGGVQTFCPKTKEI